MGNEDSPLTMGVFTKYIMRLEENMATKADIAGVKAELTSRLDKVESVTWSRLDNIEQKMATKDDLASVKEDTVRIRKAMAEDDIDMGKVKKRLGMVEGVE